MSCLIMCNSAFMLSLGICTTILIPILLMSQCSYGSFEDGLIAALVMGSNMLTSSLVMCSSVLMPSLIMHGSALILVLIMCNSMSVPGLMMCSCLLVPAFMISSYIFLPLFYDMYVNYCSVLVICSNEAIPALLGIALYSF